MSLVFKTTQAQTLLDAIKKEIDNKKIETWSYDSVNDFTHTPPQWNKKAWLKPTVTTTELSFEILKPTGTESLGKAIKGIYYGRFLEMVTNHFETKFTSATLTL